MYKDYEKIEMFFLQDLIKGKKRLRGAYTYIMIFDTGVENCLHACNGFNLITIKVDILLLHFVFVSIKFFVTIGRFIEMAMGSVSTQF